MIINRRHITWTKYHSIIVQRHFIQITNLQQLIRQTKLRHFEKLTQLSNKNPHKIQSSHKAKKGPTKDVYLYNSKVTVQRMHFKTTKDWERSTLCIEEWNGRVIMWELYHREYYIGISHGPVIKGLFLFHFFFTREL